MADTERSEASLLNNIFPDNQAAGSITAQDIRDLIVSAKAAQPLGWQFFFDETAVDIASAKLVPEGPTPTQVSIDPFESEDLLYPPQSPLAWNSVDDEDGSGILNRINPQLLNGFGLLRLSFAAWANSQSMYFDLELDVGTSVPPAAFDNVIYTATEVFHKGTGSANHQHFNFVIPVFLGSDFSMNGGRFWVTPFGGTMECFNITLTLTNTFSPTTPSAFGL
jgi:hypothetical protein